MDFVFKAISVDEKSRIVRFVAEPNPERYEWQNKDGKRFLYDKFDKILFPEEVYFSGFTKIVGQPIYYQPNKIGNATVYVESRKPLIEKRLDGIENTPVFEDKSDDFLRSLETNELAFVVMSIDIVNSTYLATSIDNKTYVQLISVILYELSEVIPKFHGYVLKYTGDGLIAYFPEPSFIVKNDLAIDCALTIHKLIYEAINPIFEKRNIPTINIRIGLDAGEAYIETIGSPDTKQHKDIIGGVINLAVKIQSAAKPGEIYLGNTVEQNLHTAWRQICEIVEMEEGWNYKDTAGKVYKVHRVKFLR